jgi:mannosyl-oligosaccharide alpha-1,2-mannosidase
MPHHLKGRWGRRLLAITVFILTSVFLWTGFRDVRPTYTDANVYYRASSYDWSTAKVYYPVDDIRSPPAGLPVSFPPVQAPATAASSSDQIWRDRKLVIKEKFVKSWDAYKAYAWNKDELMPLSRKGKRTIGGWSAQLVDALDALWIMDLKEDFRLALRQVAVIDWAKGRGQEIDLFEVTIRYLGGLISAYELSSELVLLAKAIELGDAIYAAFDTPNRLPARWLDYAKAKAGEQVAHKKMPVATIGTLSMELTRLSQLTGDFKYYDAADRVKDFFYQMQNETLIPGLWPQYANCRDEVMPDLVFTLGAGADSLFEYLPKMHALLGGRDPAYEAMAIQALDAIRDNLLFRPATPGDADILFAGNAVNRDGKTTTVPETQHLACFSGGMYGLAGKLLARDDYVKLGHRLAAGCVWAYDAFPTNVMPDISRLVACKDIEGPCVPGDILPGGTKRDKRDPEGFVSIRGPSYHLRPEAVESVFYMWRITGDDVWREAAWRMWQGIAAETETEFAFAAIEDVRDRGSPKMDSMDTFWMSETLKYLYLTFEDPSVISLDNWVFNTEAHPFRRPR